MAIRVEGLDSLSYEELQQACRERGMRGMLSKQALTRQLSSWLSLSLDKNLPVSLLLLSRAFTYSASVDTSHLQSALSSLSPDAMDEVELRMNERETIQSLDIRAIRDTLKNANAENLAAEKKDSEAMFSPKGEDSTPLSSLVSIEKDKIALDELRAASDREIGLGGEALDHDKAREKRLANRLRGKVLSLLEKIEMNMTKSEKEALPAKDSEERVRRQIPSILDRNGDNFISRAELGQAMEELGVQLNEEELEELWHDLDEEKSGAITLERLIQFVENELTMANEKAPEKEV